MRHQLQNAVLSLQKKTSNPTGSVFLFPFSCFCQPRKTESHLQVCRPVFSEPISWHPYLEVNAAGQFIVHWHPLFLLRVPLIPITQATDYSSTGSCHCSYRLSESVAKEVRQDYVCHLLSSLPHLSLPPHQTSVSIMLILVSSHILQKTNPLGKAASCVVLMCLLLP